jgi:hypothetical protein
LAAIIESADPKALLSEFRAAIRNKKITTWVEDPQDHFTHTSQQWARQAWLKPSVSAGQLVMTLLWPNQGNPGNPQAVLAFYFGHFIETMIRDFPSRMSRGIATPREN